MGIFKLGIFMILMGILLIPPLLVLSVTIGPSHDTAEYNAKVLGARDLKHEVGSVSAHLTLIPQDQIHVVPVVIIEVIDINTVRVLLNDGMDEIDLVGIKIPTTTSQARYEKCYGETIETSIQKLALGKKAYMIDDREYEGSQTPHKYIFLDDITFLNLELIKRGITSANITDPYLYIEDFSEARTQAEESSLGVWYDACPVSPAQRTALSKTTKKPTPTLKPSILKAKSTPTPTITNNLYSRLLSPTPTKTPTPTPAPTSDPMTAGARTSGPKPTSLNPEILFVLINNHRKSIGKTPFEKDTNLCSLAVERGPELYDEIFVTHNVHAGLERRNLPYWITENMAHYNSEEQVFNWWMGSTVHRRAIEGDHKYSCGECYGNSCAQLFTSYAPK